MKDKKEAFQALKYKLIGVDWAKGSGMNRGEVIKRESNVIHVRFKTVTV